MMQRSLDASSSCPPEHSRLMKRARRLSRRDYKQTVGSIQRMNAGGVLMPDEEGGEGQMDMSPSTGKNANARDQHVLMDNGTRNSISEKREMED